MAVGVSLATPAEASTISISGDRVVVDGKPFAVRGAAGDGPLPELEQLGGTTIRTYGGDPGEVLDAAGKAGLKVIAGLWLGHPRAGADYKDRAFVARQLAEISAVVEKYRDHPALLMWGIGNEPEVDIVDDTLIWPAVEEAAQRVKALDPAHPTMAVIAEVGNDKARKLKQLAPHIDVLGVNAYGDGLYSVGSRAREQGWLGPIVITEMGARGHWQAATTPWGAPFELTSTQKAIEFRRYLKALGDADVGALVFLWGQKQEVTPSYHSLRLATGEWTETAEAMAENWGGTTPGGNHAPRIAALRFAHDPSAPFASWPAGQAGAVVLGANDPDGDPLEVRWEIMAETTVRSVGGDAEEQPHSFPKAVEKAGLAGATVGALPPGRYRIFVELRDGRGAAATGNLPFEIR
jgi:endonuclease YncB( thermonuclease family)